MNNVVNPLDMSDEDFLNSPQVFDDTVVEPVKEDDDEEKPVVVEEPVTEPIIEEETTEVTPEVTAEPVSDDASNQAPEEALEPVKEAQPIDYEAFYKEVMTPFKANGKEISLRDANEAITLMQKGANYTRKMQDLAPYRKVLKMLENNNLLDESKVSYLIDVDKKNPEAIKKLLKDGNIDPFEFDMSEEPKYVEGRHKISDADIRFQSAIDELSGSEAGQNTLQILNSWDNASINALYSDPTGISAIHDQIQSGVYNQIMDEVERAKVIGTIPTDMPLIEAYKAMGNYLLQQKTARQPIATGVAPVGNSQAGARVKSASIPRQSPRTQHQSVNPLELSDEEFLKQFAGRL